MMYHFFFFVFSVIAIDNDPNKIELARHNAELYGVADRIQFIIGDFFALAPTLKADVVFLSPPWGGPDVMQLEEYKLSNLMPDNGGGENILCLARQITSNLAIHLPKNTNIFDVKKYKYKILNTSWLIPATLFITCKKNIPHHFFFL